MILTASEHAELVQGFLHGRHYHLVAADESLAALLALAEQAAGLKTALLNQERETLKRSLRAEASEQEADRMREALARLSMDCDRILPGIEQRFGDPANHPELQRWLQSFTEAAHIISELPADQRAALASLPVAGREEERT